MHVIAAKAVAFKIAATRRVPRPPGAHDRRRPASSPSGSPPRRRGPGIDVLTGGTDVHLVLVDLRDSALDGQQAEDLLHESASR